MIDSKNKTTKEMIEETSIKLFRKYGYHATSIAMIAKDSNVSKAALYHYMDSKIELLNIILLRQHKDFKRKVLDISNKKDFSKQERWKYFMAAMVKYFIDNREVYIFSKIASEMACTNKNVRHIYSSFICEWEDSLVSLMVDDMDIEIAHDRARKLIATVQGFLIIYNTRNNDSMFLRDLTQLKELKND